jgi:hypothetical protein
MCLLVGPVSEEDTWAPMKEVVRQLSARRIAQVWLHHTGHDTTKGFGTKTREWEMDTVGMLSKGPIDGGPINLEFTKARLRTPKTKDLFMPQSIQRSEDGWVSSGVGRVVRERMESDKERKKAWFLQAYNALAASVVPEPGSGIRLVGLIDIRAYMIAHGFLELEDGKLPDRERKALQRAREDLIRTSHFTSDTENFWETHPL